MPKKGATLVFEQVMLFMIGISIFMAMFFIFNSYENYFASTIADDHMEQVSDWIISNIVGVSGDDDMNVTLRVSVPLTVGNEKYTVDLEQEGLRITTLQTGKILFSPLSRINVTMSLAGGFSTVHGSEFIIYKRGSQIIIG